MRWWPSCINVNVDCCSSNSHEQQIVGSFNCEVILSSLETQRAKISINGKTKKLECDYLTGTILEFPINDIIKAQYYTRKSEDRKIIDKFRESFEKSINLIFETDTHANPHRVESDSIDYILLLSFMYDHELSIVFKSQQQLEQFHDLLNEVSSTPIEYDRLDHCMSTCIGDYEKNGVINVLLCDPNLFHEIPSVPFKV